MKTFKHSPITVLGTVKKTHEVAPNFSALNTNLEMVSLDSFKQKYVVLNVVPSLDTGVCSLQTRTINEQLASYKDMVVLTISNDLPFAQKRWCGAEGLDNVITLSDHRNLDFAMKYGVLIEELRLLARSVFVLNEKREIVYLEYLDEMSEHPNYENLFNFLNNLK